MDTESQAAARSAFGLPPVNANGQAAPKVVPVDAQPCEHVIPLRPAELTRKLIADPHLAPADRLQLERLSRLLGATFHHEYHAWLRELKDLYARLDPDSDCVSIPDASL